MNSLISTIMSLILYNPLEAMVLLLASWFFKPKEILRDKFNLTEFIVKSYILGFFNYIIQIPEAYFQDTIYYIAYLLFNDFLLMSLNLKLFGYKNKFKYISIIMSVFHLSLTIIIDLFGLPNSIEFIRNDLIYEFTGNWLIRISQAICLIILFGGQKMFKLLLKNKAKKSIGKMVAETSRGFGETKLSKKLAKEVKESK